MCRCLRIFLPVLLVGVLLSGQLVSAQVANGTILGIVQDSSGAVIPGVSVTVKNLDTGITRTATTDEAGRYTIPDLSLGNYEVEGQLAGFQTEARTGITITVGREAVVNLALKVGQVSDKVTITEEAPLVESTTAAMSSLVDERTIRDLPLNGRSWDNLALLQPGVVTVGAGQGSPAFDFGTGARFNVNGSRAYANSFLLDGTDINDHANGTPGGSAGTNLGVDGVQEFKINTLVSPAEFGRSTGGTVSAVTRSGTNDLHGAAFGFLRNNAFDSLGYFDQVSHGGTGSVAPYRRGQFGAALGGPIQKDKTFFFGTYEGLRQGSGTVIGPEVPTALTKQGIVPYTAFQGTDPNLFNCHKGDTACVVPVDSAIKPFLDLFQAPSPGSNADFGDGTGSFNAAPLQVTNENYFMNRVDHQINSKMNMFVRYSYDSDSNIIPNFNGSSIANEQDVSRRQYSTIQFSNIIRPNVVNSFRFAYNRTYQNFDDVVVDPRAEKLSFLNGEHFGTISFGGQGLSTAPLNFLGVDNGAPRIYYYNLFQYADDLTYVKGPHSFKMGVDAKRIQDNLISSSNSRGDYTFQDIPGFLANKPIRFDAPSPGSNAYRGDRQNMFGIYLQDDFKATPRLTLNLGLRYEFVTNPYEVNGKMANLLHLSDPAPTVLKDSFFSIGKKEFQPRVGFAWGLNGSGKTVLRAGFGMFNDHILPYSYGNFSTGYPPFFTTLSDVRDPVAAFTNPIGFPFDPALSNGTPPPPQFGGFPIGTIKEPYKTSYNLSLQQQVMNNTVFEMAYIGSESHRLQRNGEWNPATPISPGVFPAVFNQNNRINPKFASLTVARFDVNANYNALQLSLKRRGASGLQYQVAYTYAHSIDEKSTLAGGESRQEPNTVLDLTDVKRDRGRSSFDARHNFVPTVTYPLPFRFQQKALGLIAGGWTVNGIATFRTGEPFTGRVGNNRSGNGDRWFPDRPNLNPGFSNNPTSGVTQGCAGVKAGQQLGTPDLWFDPCAFSRPAPGTYGNLGRNTLTGPGFYNFDFSADKLFKPSDRVGVQLRAEIFNLLDQAHFYAPGFNVFSGSAGKITRLISSPGGRLIQFGAKITF